MCFAIIFLAFQTRRGNKMNVMRFINAVTALALLIVPSGFSCAHDPVSEEYYLDIGRVRGGEKPSPPPCIDGAVMDGTDIAIEFNCTRTIDPDTGNADNLTYVFYWSSEDPALFPGELSYYDELFYLGAVAHADAGPDMKVRVNPGGYRGVIYFWMTAHDGGRESDHSNVVHIAVP